MNTVIQSTWRDFYLQQKDIARRFTTDNYDEKCLVVYVPQHCIHEQPIKISSVGTIIILVDNDTQVQLIHTFDDRDTEENSVYIFARQASTMTYYPLITGTLSAVRLQLNIQLNDKRAHVRVRGAYVLNGDQHVNIVSRQVHRAPDTTSDVVINGVLRDRAQATYNGTIVVEHNAHRSNAVQENKNMLLNRGTRAVSKPILEVLTNDVQCAHASAVGQLREDELLYAQTRGLSYTQAYKMLITGFLHAVIDCNDARQVLNAGIERRL